MIETEKAVKNFALKGRTVNLRLIYAVTEVKKACAITNGQLKLLEMEKAEAIAQACDRILEGDADDRFAVQALQGGAGTSTNMNVNEVISLLADESGVTVHPLDDVNRNQSTNDVYPTALRIACIRLVRSLSEACATLQESLQKKEVEYQEVVKLGRTQLMDAMPVTLGQEFGAYAQAISRDRWRIYKVEERLRQVSLGGTAVGTGGNAERKYAYKAVEILRGLVDMGLSKAEYPMDLTQNQDVFVEVSGLLKALAVNLMKIATDLRLMNSGPGGGLGEIRLEKLQRGSTIMPGKVNPVIPEMVTQVAIRVMANDTAITMCASNGNLELNAFMPLIADALLESLELLVSTVKIFGEKCIDTLKANPQRCLDHVNHSLTLTNALVPILGYEKAEEIHDRAAGDPDKVREIVLADGYLDEVQVQEILDITKISTYK